MENKSGGLKSTILIFFMIVFVLAVSVIATVDLVAPPDNQWVPNNNDSVPLQFNVTTANGLVSGTISCNITLNGAVVAQNASVATDTTTMLYSDTAFNLGSNLWNVTCSNTTHVNSYATWTLNYDAAAPTVAIEVPNHTWYDTATPAVYFNVTDDADSIINFTIYVDGSSYLSGVTANGNTNTTAALSTLAQGAHTVKISVWDEIGMHVTNTSLYTIYVDTANPVVTPITPDNFNFSSAPATVNFSVADNLANPLTCSLYINGTVNATVFAVNNTNTGIMFGAAEGDYAWYVNCTDNASNWHASSARTLTMDYVGPVINSFELGEPDDFVSDNAANNHITLMVNVTDSATGVYYVTANLSDLSGDINGTDFQNLTYNGGSGLWELVVNVTDSSTYDFEPVNISLLAYDYIPRIQAGGQDVYTVILYNMTLMPGDPEGCGNIVAGSTDFSAESDWTSIDLLLLIDLNYSTSCGLPAFAADNQLHRAARFNFSSMNLTSEAAFRSLGQFMSSIDVELTPEGQWGDSRIYVNSSALSAFNTTSTITLYGLPFDAIPTIIGDLGTADNGTGVSYVIYTDPLTNYTLGNLTFTVQGFSGYNVSDTTDPVITVNAPAPNLTTVQGPDVLINLTVNGTGTMVSNLSVLFNGVMYYRYNMSCVTVGGSEILNCSFILYNLADTTHQFTAYAWDYGSGSPPGNSETLVWNFSTDSTVPVVAAPVVNASLVTGTTSIKVNVNATDPSGISNCTVNSVEMTNMTGGRYELNTTANSLNCAAVGPCTLRFNATDAWGLTNSSVTTSINVDSLAPYTTAPTANASAVKAARSGTTVRISINVTDVGPAGVANVTVWNTSMVQMSDMGGGMWRVDTTGTLLGCSAGNCTLYFNATDSLGNSNTSVTYVLLIDDTAPAVSGASLSASEVKSGTGLRINVTATDAASTVTSVRVNGTSMTHIGSGVYSLNTTAAGLGCTANTVCTLGFSATDSPGNTNSAVTTTVVVDDTAPVVNFVYNSSDVNNSANNFQLNVTVTEINTNASVTANGQAMSQVGSSNVWTITETGDNLLCTSTGNCTVTFSATDGAGNVGTDTTVLRIDNDPPVVSGASINVTRAKIGATVRVRATVTDTPGGVASVTVNGSATSYLGGGVYEVNETGSTFGCPANALCTLTFNAIDNFGSRDRSVSVTYTTDNVAPANTTAFSASAASTSASVSATMSESAKCTVTYGTNVSDLSSSANSSTFTSTLSVALSGLSASTVYYYKITNCWDLAGNSQNLNLGPFNFTTSAASTGGGSGSGGTSGSYSASYDVGDITMGSSDWNLGSGDSVKFSHVSNGYSQKHSITVKKVGSDYATFEVASTPKEVTLNIGETGNVDLDDDGKADVSMTLMDIVYNKVLLKVTSLVQRDKIDLLPPRPPKPRTLAVEEPAAEESAAEVTAAATSTEPAPAPAPAEPAPSSAPAPVVEDKQGMPGYYYVFGALLAIVVVSLIVVFLVERRRGSSGFPPSNPPPRP